MRWSFPTGVWASLVLAAPALAQPCPNEGQPPPAAQIVQDLADVEAHACEQADALDEADGGHSLDRHGPQVTDAQHQRRLTTGVAADGAISAAPASTEFATCQEWLRTRALAIQKIVERDELDLSRPPPDDMTNPYFRIVLEHDHTIGHGFIGDPDTAHKIQAHDPQTGEPILDRRGRPVRIKVFDRTEPVPAIYRTTTSLAWDEELGRWVVAQHYPDARD